MTIDNVAAHGESTPTASGAAASSQAARRALWTVFALALAAFAFMEWVALTQWLSGHWYLADVGNIHYCLFNTLHGSFMASPQHDAINHFAFHFTPFLLLLLPLVPLSVYPVPLVTSYVVALALCVPAVFALARREGVDPWGGVALAWLFLANHFVGSLELANHFEVFYLLFILLAMAARGTRWLFPLALLAMTVKEDAALWIAGWAAVECWFAGGASQRKRYAWLIAGALACLAVAGATILILQRIHGQGAMTEYGPRFRGMSFGVDSLLTFALLLGSFALLPLLAGRRALLILLPVPVLLSNFPFMRHQLYYYSYPFLPFLAVTSCIGYVRLGDWLESRGWSTARRLLPVALVLVGAAQWPLPTRTDGYRRLPFEVTARDRYRFDLARTVVPPDAPLALQFGLWGITPHRTGTHLLAPRTVQPADWVFMDLQSPHGLAREDFIAAARQVMDDVQAGRRRALHSRYDIFIVSPVMAAQERKP